MAFNIQQMFTGCVHEWKKRGKRRNQGKFMFVGFAIGCQALVLNDSSHAVCTMLHPTPLSTLSYPWSLLMRIDSFWEDLLRFYCVGYSDILPPLEPLSRLSHPLEHLPDTLPRLPIPGRNLVELCWSRWMKTAQKGERSVQQPGNVHLVMRWVERGTLREGRD